MKILIASHNVHKIREFRAMFAELLPNFEVLTLHQYPDYQPPEETGATFKENALIKARDAASALKHYVIADDSGLVVPKLEGAPGVYSRRYAGDDATDAENRKKLLDAMKDLSDIERAAYYECELAFVTPEGVEQCFTGICEGEVLTQEKGGHGFGYDPLFLKHDYDKSFAEIKEELKNLISHRRKAFDKFATALEMLEARKANGECNTSS